MKVWTLANQKGGVGKTTTAAALGGLLAAWGFRTLLLDIDPHGSLTSYFGYDPDEIEDGVYALFQAAVDRQPISPDDLIRQTGTEGLDLLPASTALATLDRQAGRQEGMGLVLKRSLEQIDPGYDYALIDCPPVLGVLLINALAACEQLIIPVQNEFLAIKGLARIQVPDWAQQPFRCLFFRLLGVTLAVPLASLHGITKWNGELTKIPGQPDWYLGLWLYRGSRVVVVDIARLIMPERLGLETTAAPEQQHLLIVGPEGGWGLCCGAIQRPEVLDQRAVKWRPENCRQPWFAGTVVDRLCMLLNIPALLVALGTDYA